MYKASFITWCMMNIFRISSLWMPSYYCSTFLVSIQETRMLHVTQSPSALGVFSSFYSVWACVCNLMLAWFRTLPIFPSVNRFMRNFGSSSVKLLIYYTECKAMQRNLSWYVGYMGEVCWRWTGGVTTLEFANKAVLLCKSKERCAGCLKFLLYCFQDLFELIVNCDTTSSFVFLGG